MCVVNDFTERIYCVRACALNFMCLESALCRGVHTRRVSTIYMFYFETSDKAVAVGKHQ